MSRCFNVSFPEAGLRVFTASLSKLQALSEGLKTGDEWRAAAKIRAGDDRGSFHVDFDCG